MKTHPSRFVRREIRHGFALIVTLSLMILLTVIAVGLLSLASISLRSSAQGEAMRVAQANARMAVLIALGELQTNLGADARTSARAETLAKRVGGTVSPNTPKAWWVGVSNSDATVKLSPSGKDVEWLISGLDGGNIDNNLGTPVKMFGAGSLDLAAHTGGKDIEAGRVPVVNTAGKKTGSYAWFVDDNGMKAQLRPSDPAIRNDNPTNPSGGVLAASYLPNILTGMTTVSATQEQLQRVSSIRDLELVGLGKPVIREKFFGYTALSQGVLSDTKKGGLKKDLTIAFENSAVFNQVFPAGNTSQYLLITQDKLDTASDLKNNGYIHWAIFRDYYNLKKNIKMELGIPSVQIATFSKDPYLTDSSRVNKAPHELKDASAIPYGQPTVLNGGAYVNNPISPVLARIQENCWLEYNAGSGPTKPVLTTHAQLWSSHYNPYNIAINDFNGPGTGPRLMNFPMIAVTVPGYLNRVDTISNKLQIHAPGQVLIPPGKSQMLGFATNATLGLDTDDLLYSSAVKNLVTESVKVDHTLVAALPATITFKTEFYSPVPSFLLGCDDKSGNLEVSQIAYTPFAWDRIVKGPGTINAATISKSTPTPGLLGAATDLPGKTVTRTLSRTDLGRSSMASLNYVLRTTRESNSALRPLIDSNIRAQWSNPRWDGPLGLNVVATHSMDLNGEPTDQIPQAETSSPPLGFTYLGSGNSGADPNRVILFDVPRKDLVSLGQLQHASAGRFSYEPSYIVGNSYANPRIPLDNWKGSVSDLFSNLPAAVPQWKINGNFNLYDASYLVNEVLFDSYIFTTIPQANDNFGGGDVPANSLASILAGTTRLPNSRFIPYVPAGSQFTATSLQKKDTATTGSFFHNAGHLLVDGSFNVNSTSVDAWEAFLSGTFKLPAAKINDKGVLTGFTQTENIRFPRVASNFGVGMKTTSINDNFWTGFRELTQDEVRQIAVEMVKQVKNRGPFLTMGDFVNRRLKTDDTGKSGALQAALDATVNQSVGGMANPAKTSGAFSNLPAGSSQGAGFPGQLLQGDILQALGPYMTVRSDTFTIRAYGEAMNPKGDITAKAWCEVVVQRFPDPVTPTAAAKPLLQELVLPSSPFGRKFSILSFRWLNPVEV